MRGRGARDLPKEGTRGLAESERREGGEEQAGLSTGSEMNDSDHSDFGKTTWQRDVERVGHTRLGDPGSSRQPAVGKVEMFPALLGAAPAPRAQGRSAGPLRSGAHSPG